MHFKRPRQVPVVITMSFSGMVNTVFSSRSKIMTAKTQPELKVTEHCNHRENRN